MKLVRLVPVSLTDLSPPDLDEALAIAQARVRARHRSLVDAVDWMEAVYGELDRRQATAAASTGGKITDSLTLNTVASARRSSRVGGV